MRAPGEPGHLSSGPLIKAEVGFAGRLPGASLRAVAAGELAGEWLFSQRHSAPGEVGRLGVGAAVGSRVPKQPRLVSKVPRTWFLPVPNSKPKLLILYLFGYFHDKVPNSVTQGVLPESPQTVGTGHWRA